jgi:hypothetical protein
MSLRKSLASYSAIIMFWSWWTVFFVLEASLCGAEYGMRLCVLTQSVSDKACPKLVRISARPIGRCKDT